MTIQNQYYWFQNSHEGKFQDWQPHSEYTPGNRTTAEVKLSEITQARIAFMVANHDTVCPMKNAREAWD